MKWFLKKIEEGITAIAMLILLAIVVAGCLVVNPKALFKK